ncbi:hypothetical protein J2793_007267 [Paraburkholderia caledonica]|uniref:Secreted protein n=1 Tax=Paraburkholderia caledonica TaxID=134536 RepID=A0AB73IQZ6_9BURK|nr:hypothetical protein [Paraburkholderia caledonica]
MQILLFLICTLVCSSSKWVGMTLNAICCALDSLSPLPDRSVSFLVPLRIEADSASGMSDPADFLIREIMSCQPPPRSLYRSSPNAIARSLASFINGVGPTFHEGIECYGQKTDCKASPCSTNSSWNWRTYVRRNTLPSTTSLVQSIDCCAAPHLVRVGPTARIPSGIAGHTGGPRQHVAPCIELPAFVSPLQPAAKRSQLCLSIHFT